MKMNQPFKILHFTFKAGDLRASFAFLLKIGFIALCLLFDSSYLESKPINIIYINFDISSSNLKNAITLAVGEYFETSLVESPKASYNITLWANKDCSATPLYLAEKSLLLCALHDKFQGPQFNQLLAAIDSPLTRSQCVMSQECSLPKELVPGYK